MALPPDLIRDARQGDRFKLQELAELLTPRNYTLSALNAILINFRAPTLANHATITPATSRIFLTAVGAMAGMDYVSEVCEKLDPKDERREKTVTSILSQSDQIFEWFSCIFQWTPRFTPFNYETGGMTVNNVCGTLNGLMKLDERIADRAIGTLSASFIALRLWSLRTPPGDAPTRLMIPPGSNSLELLATYVQKEQGARVLEGGMTAPFIVDRFADAFIERLDIVDSTMISKNPNDLHEAERHLNICFMVLRRLCRTSPLVHAALWRRNYISRWCKTLLFMIPHMQHFNALRLTAQILQISTECNGNTINAVLDFVKSGLLQAILRIFPLASYDNQITGQTARSILFRINKYCYRCRTAKAINRALLSIPDTSETLVEHKYPLSDYVSTLYDQLGSAAALFSQSVRSRASGATTICDNALHRHGTGIIEYIEYENPQTCSGCHLVVYCGDNCQREDWKRRHRKECAVMKKAHRARTRAQRRYHFACRASQTQLIANVITAPYSIDEMQRARQKHGSFITIYDTTKDPPEMYIYKLPIDVYLRKRLPSDCSAMEKRVNAMVQDFARSASGTTFLLDAGFGNGCDEMIAVLMKLQIVEGRWRVVESVPRMLPNARYGLFPESDAIALR